ncbi:acyl-CoA dehydrogenase family protein [Plantibacter sp. YIM 135249]|uniref:acyl-CoA dehydrogenase family protein n=1 Tax=Plantibacter sp. YIM 135249 TaxID=3423918 RepID=UPI003D32D904
MSEPTRLESALDRLRPVFARIAGDAVGREQRHELPHEAVRLLVDAGFASLRLPVADGGAGLTIEEFATVLIELGAADANLPQIFRGHIAFVEDQLVAEPSPARSIWLERFATGETVGNAWSEVGSTALWSSQTQLVRTEAGWVLSGRKFYTTGSIYADWIDVIAHNATDGTEVSVLVRATTEGITISDDWDGFGQQLTATGSIVFEDVAVDETEIRLLDARFPYQTSLFQLVLLTVLAGIATAVERDAGAHIRARKRVYSHGNSPVTSEDPQILAVAGEIASTAFVTEATVLAVAARVQAAHLAALEGLTHDQSGLYTAAEIASAAAQVSLSTLVPAAATQLFDTLGASAVSRSQGLDRHWRNARTVISHNPWIYKARTVGDWSVNGTPPPFSWTVGRAVQDGQAAQAGQASQAAQAAQAGQASQAAQASQAGQASQANLAAQTEQAASAVHAPDPTRTA